MYIIETQHEKIPWRWVVILMIMSQARIFALFASFSMTFTMRKFIDSPAIINSVSSLDVLFNLLIAAPCLYFSDRIWTKRGRRLPFILPSFVGLAVVIMLLPLAGSAVPMGVMVVLWLLFWDVGASYDILVMEIIPPAQRGRASALNAWMLNGVIMLSAIVITGRFDDVVTTLGITLRGEVLIYWWGAACLVFCAVLLAFFVREIKPATPPSNLPNASLKGMFGGMFADKSLWPVYMLVFFSTFMTPNLGAIDPLLITEQWGYSKQDMGTNVLVGGSINMIIIIPLIALVVDRVDRLRMFGLGAAGILVLLVCYYFFVRFGLPDRRPTIAQIILFGQMLSIFTQLMTVSLQPLIFDFIPRDKMGTCQAGLSFVRSMTRLISVNAIGFWVAYYSKWFLPAGKYDYFSGYQFLIIANFIGCLFLIYFARQVKRGIYQPVGATGFQPVVKENAPGEPILPAS